MLDWYKSRERKIKHRSHHNNNNDDNDEHQQNPWETLIGFDELRSLSILSIVWEEEKLAGNSNCQTRLEWGGEREKLVEQVG